VKFYKNKKKSELLGRRGLEFQDNIKVGLREIR